MPLINNANYGNKPLNKDQEISELKGGIDTIRAETTEYQDRLKVTIHLQKGEISELKSQLASNHSYAQHVADDLGWYDRSELRKSMLDNLYKIIGDYPHPYIERLEKQLEGKR